MEGLDAYESQALEILSDTGLADALDLTKEDPRVVERYGVNDPRYLRDGAPRMIRNFASPVGWWKRASGWFPSTTPAGTGTVGTALTFPAPVRSFLFSIKASPPSCATFPSADWNGIVSVVVWGEFGRTPKINKMNSRDHWPRTSFALLAGRHEARAGHWPDGQAGRRDRGPPGPLSGSLLHTLPFTRDRSPGQHCGRSRRPSPLPSRPRRPAHPRAHLVPRAISPQNLSSFGFTSACSIAYARFSLGEMAEWSNALVC